MLKRRNPNTPPTGITQNRENLKGTPGSANKEIEGVSTRQRPKKASNKIRITRVKSSRTKRHSSPQAKRPKNPALHMNSNERKRPTREARIDWKQRNRTKFLTDQANLLKEQAQERYRRFLSQLTKRQSSSHAKRPKNPALHVHSKARKRISHDRKESIRESHNPRPREAQISLGIRIRPQA